MRKSFFRLTAAAVLYLSAFAAVSHGQSDASKIFNANCALCHMSNGSGDSPTGKALHAKDLRSDEVQKQDDAALTETITKGKGKMPAFGTKIKPDNVAKLVAYIRQLPTQK